MKISVKKGDLVYLEKLSDDKFEGIHPNGIDKGYSKIGTLVDDITVGNSCFVTGEKLTSCLVTSTVTEILDEHTFKTMNSTYKIIHYNNYA